MSTNLTFLPYYQRLRKPDRSTSLGKLTLDQSSLWYYSASKKETFYSYA
jgi:hypothetical protein